MRFRLLRSDWNMISSMNSTKCWKFHRNQASSPDRLAVSYGFTHNIILECDVAQSILSGTPLWTLGITGYCSIFQALSADIWVTIANSLRSFYFCSNYIWSVCGCCGVAWKRTMYVPRTHVIIHELAQNCSLHCVTSFRMQMDDVAYKKSHWPIRGLMWTRPLNKKDLYPSRCYLFIYCETANLKQSTCWKVRVVLCILLRKIFANRKEKNLNNFSYHH